MVKLLALFKLLIVIGGAIVTAILVAINALIRSVGSNELLDENDGERR